MTAIIDYGAGNLTSGRYAFSALKAEAVVTRDASIIESADRVVFPGVGAAGSAMENLRSLGLVELIRRIALSGKPFLGICLGMQVLFDHSEEDGGVDLLGIIPGQVRRFPDVPGFKVPEIGWNQVDGGTNYYFVHSYYAEICPFTAGRTEYAGVEFTSVVRRGALLACQFHPEKSGAAGLAFLSGFLGETMVQ